MQTKTLSRVWHDKVRFKWGVNSPIKAMWTKTMIRARSKHVKDGFKEDARLLKPMPMRTFSQVRYNRNGVRFKENARLLELT